RARAGKPGAAADGEPFGLVGDLHAGERIVLRGSRTGRAEPGVRQPGDDAHARRLEAGHELFRQTLLHEAIEAQGCGQENAFVQGRSWCEQVTRCSTLRRRTPYKLKRSDSASVPIPTFAPLCGALVCERRNRRTLAAY